MYILIKCSQIHHPSSIKSVTLFGLLIRCLISAATAAAASLTSLLPLAMPHQVAERRRDG